MAEEEFDFSAFPGFYSPRYTPIPDQLLDHVMAHLSGAELKVLLYIMRHTYGYKKSTDSISIRQMVDGIVGGDGHVVDEGTGLSKASVHASVKNLEAKQLIMVERRETAAGDAAVNVYRVRESEELVGGTNNVPPCTNNQTTVVRKLDPQGRTLQDTKRQNENDSDSLSLAKRIGARYGQDPRDRKALATSLGKWPAVVVEAAVADLENKLGAGFEISNSAAYLNSLLPAFAELEEERTNARNKVRRERFRLIASMTAVYLQSGDSEERVREHLQDDFPGAEDLIDKAMELVRGKAGDDG